jgi:beta-barrel assembly-enhancing protease
MSRFAAAIFPIILLTLAGCAQPRTQPIAISNDLMKEEAAKQRVLALQAHFETVERLDVVGFNVLSSGTDFCEEKTRQAIGIRWANYLMLDGEMREAASSLIGSGKQLSIIHVIPNSPAHHSGLQEGDILIAANGMPAPTGEKATTKFTEILSEELKKSEGGLSLTVLRHGETKAFNIEPTTVCDFDLALERDETINAYADGEKIAVTYGMMRFASKDEELALVISHELGHNAMGHIDDKTLNVVGGGALGLVVDILAAIAGVDTGGEFAELGMKAGAQAYSQDFEREADYVGLYIMARTNYPIDSASNFWRRMATLQPSAIDKGFSHPTTPERAIALDSAAIEIRGKLVSGAALMPEMKQ